MSARVTRKPSSAPVPRRRCHATPFLSSPSLTDFRYNICFPAGVSAQYVITHNLALPFFCCPVVIEPPSSRTSVRAEFYITAAQTVAILSANTTNFPPHLVATNLFVGFHRVKDSKPLLKPLSTVSLDRLDAPSRRLGL